MVMNIKDYFPDWKSIDKDEWGDNTIIEYGNNGNKFIEIGLYREEDGRYTLQIFNGEDVILCEDVSEEIGYDDFERARTVGEIWDANRKEFDKMIEGVDYYGRDLDDQLLCHVYDFINWNKYNAGNLEYEQVKDALEMFIYNVNEQRIVLQDIEYDEVHKGFVSGLYRATDKEIEQAEEMWESEDNEYCLGYYEEAFNIIRDNQ